MMQQQGMYDWLEDVSEKARLYEDIFPALNELLAEKYNETILIGRNTNPHSSYTYTTLIKDEPVSHRHIYDALKRILDNLPDAHEEG